MQTIKTTELPPTNAGAKSRNSETSMASILTDDADEKKRRKNGMNGNA
jgi:hypothetical protein